MYTTVFEQKCYFCEKDINTLKDASFHMVDWCHGGLKEANGCYYFCEKCGKDILNTKLLHQ